MKVARIIYLLLLVAAPIFSQANPPSQVSLVESPTVFGFTFMIWRYPYQACRCRGVDFIFHEAYGASSSAYGDMPTLPKHEEMKPNPISPYAVAKLANENYMTSFYHCYGLETISLRYFNVFGPRQDSALPYSGVLAKFIAQMLHGESPTIQRDGSQSRDFTYIDNVVNANLLASQAPAAEVTGRVFNVANGISVHLNKTFRLLSKLIGFDGEPNYGLARTADEKDSLADLSHAERHMGYAPRGHSKKASGARSHGIEGRTSLRIFAS
jgi:UDP-glucose 4-epimerase